MTGEVHVPFSQRHGFEEVPPQLKLGEVSDEFRRLLNYYIALELERECSIYHQAISFRPTWERVSRDLHVIFFQIDISSYQSNVRFWQEMIGKLVEKGKFAKLLDFIEFLLLNSNCSATLKGDIAQVFVQSRSAYRVVDNQIVAVGTAQQADAIAAALSDAEDSGADAARSHLVSAGVELRRGDWAGSVRESIHAVESIAKKIHPEAKTLGEALKAIERH